MKGTLLALAMLPLVYLIIVRLPVYLLWRLVPDGKWKTRLFRERPQPNDSRLKKIAIGIALFVGVLAFYGVLGFAFAKYAPI